MFNENIHRVDAGKFAQGVGEVGANMEVKERDALEPGEALLVRGALPVSGEEAVALYRKMQLIRLFEEEAARGFTRTRIGGYFHTCVGEEASVVGVVSALREDDYLITSYREHGHALARGLPPREVMAELYGRSTGSSHGKGGSMHIFDAKRHFLGGSGIVGGNIPIGAGVGFALRYLDTDSVCACFFGDGAVNEGTFHEAMNMAGLWKLPVLFVCENNLYGMGTHVSRANAVPEMTERAAGYGMERYRVDGMDLFDVRAVADELIGRIRRERRPIFLESLTYRFLGHGSHDPGKYRSAEEVEHWKQRDPLKLAEETLRQLHLLDDASVKAAYDESKAAIDDAAQFAEKSPAPETKELYTDVYA